MDNLNNMMIFFNLLFLKMLNWDFPSYSGTTGTRMQIASLQNSQNKATSAASKPSHPHSADNWQSPGDLGLAPTLLIIAFVIGFIFLASYVVQRQGWLRRNSDDKGKYESLPKSIHDQMQQYTYHLCLPTGLFPLPPSHVNIIILALLSSLISLWCEVKDHLG